jgi:hypothetical protein
MIQKIEPHTVPRSDLCNQAAVPQMTNKQVEAPILKVGRALAIRCSGLVAATLFACGDASADANSVMNYSDTRLLSAGAEMAEALSANAPVRVDKSTVLLSAIFVRQTKTFIYRYESSQPIDLGLGRSYAIRVACGDPIRKAFMYRGLVFRHSYLTPTGQQNLDVRYSDC